MEDGLYVDTTEPQHDHYCARCGNVWGHADESCVGPRWRGYTTFGNWDCPMCEFRFDERD